MYSKLNWFESKITNKVVASGSEDTTWTASGAYSKSHAAKWTFLKTINVINGTAYAGSDTKDHSDTTLTQKQYIWWKAKSETIKSKTKQQYCKYKTDPMLLNGYMTLIDDKYFSDLSDKYSRCYLCEHGVTTESMSENIPSENKIPQPDSFSVQYDDFDHVKQDGSWVTGVNRSDSTGYLVRDRIRPNLRTLTIGWSKVTSENAARILTGFTRTEWMLVNFLDPLSNTNITKVFAITSKSVNASYNGYWSDLSFTLEEI